MTHLQPPSPHTPTVSIVTPTFNHEAYIVDAIESVLAQTFTDWELVIVDDGSTDDTLRIARSFRDPRIKILANEHRGLERLVDTYRDALSASRGRLVAILEGDDRWPQDKLALQVPDFDTESVVMSYGSGVLIDEFGCTYGRIDPSLDASVRANNPVGAILPGLLAINPILSPTVVVRRTTLDSIGGFWQPAGVPYVDHPTWLLLALRGTFAYHGEIVGYWRRHAEQWTSRLSWGDGDHPPPEATYLGQVLDVAARQGALIPPLSTGKLAERHRERWLTNRWRLVLLAGSPRDVASTFTVLVRSGRPRLAAIGLAGVGAWLMGSDLEWLQRQRHRVSWPSRRHIRRRHRGSDRGVPAPTISN